MYIAAGLQSKQNVDCKAFIYHKMKEDWQRTEYFRELDNMPEHFDSTIFCLLYNFAMRYKLIVLVLFCILFNVL